MTDSAGAPVPSNALKKTNPWIIIIAVIVVVCCGCFGILGLILAFVPWQQLNLSSWLPALSGLVF
jgi:hypothetical protein